MKQIDTFTNEKTIYEASVSFPCTLLDFEAVADIARQKWAESYGGDGEKDDTFWIGATETRLSIFWNGPESAMGGIH